jgi:hypothetical protein
MSWVPTMSIADFQEWVPKILLTFVKNGVGQWWGSDAMIQAKAFSMVSIRHILILTKGFWK